MAKYTPKYWNREGRYQREYNILWNKYLIADSIRTGDAEATKALKRLKSFGRKYHRFYNDGDAFTFEGQRFVAHIVRKFKDRGRTVTKVFGEPTEAQMRELDRIADRLILDAWRKTKGGTLPLKNRG